MIDIHPVAKELTEKGLEEEGCGHDDWGEEKKAEDVTCAAPEATRGSIAYKGSEQCVSVEEAEAAVILVSWQENIVVLVCNREEDGGRHESKEGLEEAK